MGGCQGTFLQRWVNGLQHHSVQGDAEVPSMLRNRKSVIKLNHYLTDWLTR